LDPVFDTERKRNRNLSLVVPFSQPVLFFSNIHIKKAQAKACGYILKGCMNFIPQRIDALATMFYYRKQETENGKR